MTQSYGNPSISPILAPVDTILATTKTENPFLQAGKSISAITAASVTIAGATLTMIVDGGIPQTIILVNAMHTGDMVADYIQSLVRALGYTQFICAFDSIKIQYTLTSETVGPTSSIVITGGTAAVPLKLGVANGGVETVGSMAAGVSYMVHYFLTDGAGKYSSIEVPVAGTEMTSYIDLNELKAKANLLAAQWKARVFNLDNRTTVVVDATINGPVTL